MVKPLPKWEMKKYCELWYVFEKRSFSNEEARAVLKDDDRQLLSVLFCELRKAGWIEIERCDSDKRKKSYTLKEPNHAVKEIAKS